MNTMELRKKIADELVEDFDRLDIGQIKIAVECIRDLTTIDAMDKAEQDEVGDHYMSAYMGDRNMSNLISYINHTADDIKTMLSGSPVEHKNYVKSSMANILEKL